MEQYTTAQITDTIRYWMPTWTKKHYLPEYSSQELIAVLQKKAKQINKSLEDLIQKAPVWQD